MVIHSMVLCPQISQVWRSFVSKLFPNVVMLSLILSHPVIFSYIKRWSKSALLHLGGNNITGSLEFLCNSNISISTLAADCDPKKAEVNCSCCVACCLDSDRTGPIYGCFFNDNAMTWLKTDSSSNKILLREENIKMHTQHKCEFGPLSWFSEIYSLALIWMAPPYALRCSY